MNLLIKNFPEELHKLLKIAAVRRSKSLQALVIEILNDWTQRLAPGSKGGRNDREYRFDAG